MQLCRLKSVTLKTVITTDLISGFIKAMPAQVKTQNRNLHAVRLIDRSLNTHIDTV